MTDTNHTEEKTPGEIIDAAEPDIPMGATPYRVADLLTNHTDSRYPICEKCHKRQYERGQTYTPGENCECFGLQLKHRDSVKATQERFRNEILDIETAVRLTYNEHDADQMIKKMLDFIATLQAIQSQQAEEAVLAADATGAYHSGYLAGRAEVEEAVRENTVVDEQLIEIAEMIANGNAFDKESGFVWQHIVDEAKRLCLLKEAIKEANTPNHQD